MKRAIIPSLLLLVGLTIGALAQNLFTLPNWTSSSRYGSAPGAMGYNTAYAAPEFYDGAVWHSVVSSGAAQTGTPTIASAACGTGSNGAVVAGSDNQSGQITIGSAATTTCTLSWSTTLAVAPQACVFFPANAAAAATGTTVARVGAPSTAGVVLTGSALANANYSYVCI